MSWYKPNGLAKSQSSCCAFWTEFDEYKFIETEEKILDGGSPTPNRQWRKDRGVKSSALDEQYEKECIVFLDYFMESR